MLRCSRFLHKTSAVVVRDNPNLLYEPRYRMLRKMTLSKVFNSVTEENRYTSLRILLERLSGYVGRRQYKMANDLTKYLDPLKRSGLDWHDIKALSREDLTDVLGEGLLKLSHAERSVLLVPITEKLCGVLRRADTRHSELICMNPGVAEHGWRCGRHGHVRDVYFEGKGATIRSLSPLTTSATSVFEQRAGSVQRVEDRHGVLAEVRSMPDFTIAGRLRPTESNPRIWHEPTNANFDVFVIGFEFRVNPKDPRAKPQIEEASGEWLTHAEAVRHVLWEMLELHAVARHRQPMDIAPDELGGPDSVYSYTSVFTRRANRKAAQNPSGSFVNPDEGSDSSSSIAEENVIIEANMASDDDNVDGDDASFNGEGQGGAPSRGAGGAQRDSTSTNSSRPWFLPPLPQSFRNGVPTILPFAPTVIIQARFAAIPMDVANNEAEFANRLVQPVLELKCLVHPSACFWFSDADEVRVMQQVVDYAKRVPYAIPFNLYLRVDPAESLKGKSGEEFSLLRQKLWAEKAAHFNPREFCVRARRSRGSTGSEGVGQQPDGSHQRNHDESVVVEVGDDFGAEHTDARGVPNAGDGRTDEHIRAAENANPPGWF